MSKKVTTVENKMSKKSGNIPNEKDFYKYKWYSDKKIIGLIILFVALAMQVFAFLDLPVLTTIHSYTVGMIFGYFNPFFYLYIAYIGFSLTFDYKAPRFNWLNVNRYSYWFYVLSFMYIFVGTGYYQVAKNGWFSISSSAWKIMPSWFEEFTASGKQWWLPRTTLAGVLSSFMYAMTSTFVSGIGSFVLSILLLFFVVSKICTGQIFGFFKQRESKRRLIELNKRREETQVIKLKVEAIEEDVNHIDPPMKNEELHLPSVPTADVKNEDTTEFSVIFDDEEDDKPKAEKRKKIKEPKLDNVKKESSHKAEKSKMKDLPEDPFIDPFD